MRCGSFGSIHRVVIDVNAFGRVAGRLAAVTENLTGWTTSTRGSGPGIDAHRVVVERRVFSGFMYAHVLPASSERYRPSGRRAGAALGSGFAFGAVSASTIVYMTSGFERAMAISMRPFIVAGNPPPFTSAKVSPPSVLFHSAEPGPPELRKYGPRTR
jgi:hypothetical protein